MKNPIRRWISVLSLAALGAIPCRAGESAGPVNVKVMTFNVWFEIPIHLRKTQGVQPWDDRKSGIAQIIRRSGADLIGVQAAGELNFALNFAGYRGIETHQFLDLSEELGYLGKGEFAEVYQDAAPAWHELRAAALRFDPAIFYRRSRFVLLQSGSFALSDTPETPYSRTSSWNTWLPRSVLYARFRDKKTGKKFFFLTAHIDSNEPAKSKSIALINQLLPQRIFLAGEPAIFAATFNVDVRDPLMPQLLNDRWANSFPGLRDGDEPPHSYDDELVDHILYTKGSGIKVKSWRVPTNRTVPSDPKTQTSEHIPVFAELTF